MIDDTADHYIGCEAIHPSCARQIKRLDERREYRDTLERIADYMDATQCDPGTGTHFVVCRMARRALEAK